MTIAFQRKLEAALLDLTEDTAPAPTAGVVATGVVPAGNAATKAKQDQKVAAAVNKTQQKHANSAAKSQADQLYQAYQKAKSETDSDDEAAAAKQDVGLFNRAASSRKRMESAYQAWQLAAQNAAGQQQDHTKADTLPPEVAM